MFGSNTYLLQNWYIFVLILVMQYNRRWDSYYTELIYSEINLR